MNTNLINQTENPPQAKKQKPRGPKRLLAKAPSPAPSQPADLIKIGLDIGLNKYAYCRQVDGSLAEGPRASDPDRFRHFALEQKGLGKRVVVCYEAGLFGFELARWLIEQGLECLVMAPMKLDEGNKRVENDALNAQDILGRLDRYLAGNTRALTVCRIPSREEELARAQTRQRGQLGEESRRIQAQGRSLLWQFGYLEEGKQRWWEEKVWLKLEGRLAATVAGNLRRWRAVLEGLEEQLKELNGELQQQAKAEPPGGLARLPLGVGWLSMLLLSREIMDWKRFKNRRQMGSFTGLVPSEASTGESFRQGSVTKVGNPRIRALLVEMAWRLVRLQPKYHAVKKWEVILHNPRAGKRMRRRAIVAVSRVLAIDLWRLVTGQTTAEKLGLV